MLDNLALETHLDLSQHLAHETIDLTKQHVFASVSEFRRVVAADRACVLHLLARMVRYDVTQHSRVSKHYAQWEQLNRDHNKALWGMTKDLAGAERELAQSQGEFTDMQKEQDRLRIDLELAEARIKSLLAKEAKPKQSADSAAIKGYMAGVASRSKAPQFNRAKDLRDARAAAKTAVEESHVESLNYQLRGFRPKTQLTGTDTTAYAPWKWAVQDKLRIDSIMYSTQKDRVAYAFSQLAQPIFQQLDAWMHANSEDFTLCHGSNLPD